MAEPGEGATEGAATGICPDAQPDRTEHLTRLFPVSDAEVNEAMMAILSKGRLQ